MKKFFDKKVVIITGASSGIGKALAYEASKLGANVVLAARRENLLLEIEQDIVKAGGNALVVRTDVSVESDCKNLIDKAIGRFGQIDVMINNAGIAMRALFHELNLDVIRKVMDINYWGAVYCSYYALPHLLESHGSLVGISSVAGFKGLPGRAGYSSSKFAMQGLLEVIRIENSKSGLHTLVVCPGFTQSEIRKYALVKDGSPQGESPRNENKMMTANEVAVKTLKAIRKQRRLLILTSTGKLTIALQRFIPARLDRLVYKQMAKEPDCPFK